ATHEELPGGWQARIAEQREQPGVAVELPRDEQPRRALAHQLRRPSSSREQAQRIDENGLAGAGLAGEDRQARRELDLQVLDDRKVLDREAAKHAEELTADGLRLTAKAVNCELLAVSYFTLFCAISLAGIPPTIQPASTFFEATPIEPTI